MEINNMETVILEKDTSLREAIQKDDEKNTLQRLEDLENMNCEKDEKIEYLIDKIDKLEDRNDFYDDKVKNWKEKLTFLIREDLAQTFVNNVKRNSN